MSRRRARAAPRTKTGPAVGPPRGPTPNSPWLLARLRALLGPLRGRQLCVAFSGGLDSTVLLCLLAAGRRHGGYRLRAVHVNHHLQPAADAWAEAAAAAAHRLRVPFTLLQLTLQHEPGASPEALARTARYAALERILAPQELLLTAHHRDDQFETLLLAVLRGAGVAGLAAMPAVRPLGAHRLVRPLLPLSRAQLAIYARRHRLSWTEDSSNAEARYDRNYLRQQVLPVIRARWPAAAATAARTAEHLAQAQGLLDALADAQLWQAADGRDLCVSVLRRLAPAARRNLLRHWLRGLGARVPDHRRLEQIAGPMLAARADAQPTVCWQEWTICRHGARLVLLHAAAGAHARAADATLEWDWRRHRWLTLPGGSAIGWEPDEHGSLNLSALPPRLAVRFRRGGERLRAVHGTTTLKKLLQERRVAPWRRAALPLLFDAERLVAVADLWLDASYAATRPRAAQALSRVQVAKAHTRQRRIGAAFAPDGHSPGGAMSGARARLLWRTSD